MQAKYSPHRTLHACAQCGKEFYGRKTSQFCSVPCGNAGKRRRVSPSLYPSDPPTSTCAVCGVTFRHRRDRQRTCCSQACLLVHRERLSGTGDSFWSFVDKSGGPDACWPWTGHRSASGYGRCRQTKGTQKAHRIAYARTHGPIPDDLDMCHRCDNPPCCNPAHLFLGTMSDNIRDAYAKGRMNRDPSKHWGEKNGVAKLTEAQVIELRARFAAGEKLRQLALSYGVTYEHAWSIVKRKCWKHI